MRRPCCRRAIYFRAIGEPQSQPHHSLPYQPQTATPGLGPSRCQHLLIATGPHYGVLLQASTATPSAAQESRAVCLTNLFSAKALGDDDEFAECVEDIKMECDKVSRRSAAPTTPCRARAHERHICRPARPRPSSRPPIPHAAPRSTGRSRPSWCPERACSPAARPPMWASV